MRVFEADGCDGPEHVGAARALLRLRTGCLTMDAATRTAELRVPRVLTAEELAHPYLGPAAAIAAHWEGWTAFHAGAVVAGEGVWGIVGERERGKSSLLAHLAQSGHDVVADDVLVLRPDGTAFAGPRSIDLREEAAARLGVGRALGMAGARQRWRVALPPVAAELPLRGWVFLDWGEDPDVLPMAPSACLVALLRTLTLRISTAAPAAMLAWAGLPARRFVRPRRWDAMADGAALLMRELRSAGRVAGPA
ncbi:MAG TPA: hypothetical protein VFT50_13240 [Baekduia sp.]|nr:hypothetical protein [Baekduia sp.]